MLSGLFKTSGHSLATLSNLITDDETRVRKWQSKMELAEEINVSEGTDNIDCSQHYIHELEIE